MNVVNELRNKNIQVRVTAEEKKAIAEKAREHGLSLAAYIRTLALSAK